MAVFPAGSSVSPKPSVAPCRRRDGTVYMKRENSGQICGGAALQHAGGWGASRRAEDAVLVRGASLSSPAQGGGRGRNWSQQGGRGGTVPLGQARVVASKGMAGPGPWEW